MTIIRNMELLMTRKLINNLLKMKILIFIFLFIISCVNKNTSEQIDNELIAIEEGSQEINNRESTDTNQRKILTPKFKEIYSFKLGGEDFFPILDTEENLHIPPSLFINNDTLYVLDRLEASFYKIDLKTGSSKKQILEEEWPLSFLKSAEIDFFEHPHFLIVKSKNNIEKIENKKVSNSNCISILGENIVFSESNNLFSYNREDTNKEYLLQEHISQFISDGEQIYAVSMDGSEVYNIDANLFISTFSLNPPLSKYDDFIEDFENNKILIFNQSNYRLSLIDISNRETLNVFDVKKSLPIFYKQKKLGADLFYGDRSFYSFFKLYKNSILWIGIIDDDLKVFSLKL